jgi:hypothetical protein
MIKGDSILSKYEYDINYSKKCEDNNMIKVFVARHSAPTTILKTSQAVLTTGSTPSNIYKRSLPSPRTAA